MFYFFIFLSIVFMAIALRWYDNPKTVVHFLGLMMLAIFSFCVAVGTLIEKWLNKIIKGGMKMNFENKIEPLHDPKEEIKFWANLLENDKLNKESIELVNQGLQNAIKVYLNPYYIKIN